MIPTLSRAATSLLVEVLSQEVATSSRALRKPGERPASFVWPPAWHVGKDDATARELFAAGLCHWQTDEHIRLTKKGLEEAVAIIASMRAEGYGDPLSIDFAQRMRDGGYEDIGVGWRIRQECAEPSDYEGQILVEGIGFVSTASAGPREG